MISLLFLYDPLFTSSHDLESDYPWSGIVKFDKQTFYEAIKYNLKNANY